MASALTKEMEMMESQLNRSKEAASEALALREEAESLRSLLNRKVLIIKLFFLCTNMLFLVVNDLPQQHAFHKWHPYFEWLFYIYREKNDRETLALWYMFFSS